MCTLFLVPCLCLLLQAKRHSSDGLNQSSHQYDGKRFDPLQGLGELVSGLGLSFPKRVPYGLGPKAELAVFHFRHLSSIPDTQGVWNGRYLPFQTPCLPFQTFCLPFQTFCLPFQTVGCLPFQRPCLPFQPPRCLEWKTKENLVLKPIPQNTFNLFPGTLVHPLMGRDGTSC